VANRRAWDDELPMELARAARSGQPLCVALLDLDHFKAYNDQHGHQAGDRLLKAAAAAWQGRLRKTDLLARYGGEEFAVLLPDCGPAAAIEIAERLRTAQPEGTCSIGVAAWDGQEEATGLVARADRALYAAKKAGRDRCLADQAPAVADAAPGR
jgi:diguanylate cyclase (GGDEF)-like protein